MKKLIEYYLNTEEKRKYAGISLIALLLASLLFFPTWHGKGILVALKVTIGTFAILPVFFAFLYVVACLMDGDLPWEDEKKID